ncbi:hypothetical protein ACIP96_06500 [Streptomyces nigra]|uniref:hypothetical protein n=1 Tax=Streptomyces nigra TaxID=1827580 RepID=UPI0037F61B1F
MSAIETSAAGPAGKSTHDVGEATRTLTLPQLPYADAVHRELLAVVMPPDTLEVGERRSKGLAELFMRAVWPVDSHILDEQVCTHGLTLAWSHLTGWSAHDADGNCQLLDVDELADPRFVAHAALHFAEEPLTGTPWTPPPGPARWSEAVYLDIALGLFDERQGSDRP